MRELLHDAAERAARYLETLDERPVFPTPSALEGLRALDEPLPAGPSDPAETLRLLDEVAGPATVASAGGRYFGFVTGGSLPAALAAGWLAGAWDQNTAFQVMSLKGPAMLFVLMASEAFQSASKSASLQAHRFRRRMARSRSRRSRSAMR